MGKLSGGPTRIGRTLDPTFARVPPASTNILTAALAGVLLTLAWPATGELTPLVFTALVPLLWLLRRHCEPGGGRPTRAFLALIYLAMFIWNAATTYWLGLVQEPWTTRLLTGGFPMAANAFLMVIPWWMARWVWQRHGAWPGQCTLIATWMGFEHLHYDWDLQWPWLTLGNVFAVRTSWVQWYEWTGAAGGTLWILLANITVFHIALHVRSHRIAAARTPVLAFVALLLLPVLLSHRILHERDQRPRGPAVEIVVVQPSIDPYSEKFGGMDPITQLDMMLDLATTAVSDSTVLVVMPETALQENTYIERDPTGLVLRGLWENDMARSVSYEQMRRFQQAHPGVSLLAGMSSARYYATADAASATARPLQGGDGAYDFFNAALFVAWDGSWATYHKSKLVVGVELMPFQWLLAPLGGISLDLGGTTGTLGHGDERPIIATPDQRIRAVPAICYESVFGDHLADHARRGANMLVVMTNDGWWGTSPGYRQHLAYGCLRAIETRRPIARAANTGISCFVDAEGRIASSSAWWDRTALRGAVIPSDERTFFLVHGDLLGRVAAAVGVLLLAMRMLLALLDRSLRLAGR